MRPLVLLLSLLAAPVLAADPATYAVTDGTVTYQLIHKFHEVTGVSKKVVGKAKVLADGRVQVMVRAPAASFDSGNGNRDAHMQETVEAAKFPNVDFKAVAPSFTTPAKYPAEVPVKLEGVVNLHGVDQRVSVDAKLRFSDASHAKVQAKFPVSLEAFGVERPSLMFVKVDDKLEIAVDLDVSKEN